MLFSETLKKTDHAIQIEAGITAAVNNVFRAVSYGYPDVKKVTFSVDADGVIETDIETRDFRFIKRWA